MPNNSRTHHWKLVLLLLLLFVSLGLALDDYDNTAKYTCVFPLPILCYFVLFSWPRMLRPLRNEPRKVILFYLMTYTLMIAIFAFIYFILTESGETFHGLSTDPNSSKIINYVYFSIITATTVGYGHFFPETSMAKIVAMLEPFLTAVFLVTAFSVFSGNGQQKKEEEEQVDIAEL